MEVFTRQSLVSSAWCDWPRICASKAVHYQFHGIGPLSSLRHVPL